jgi:hypothetical protein
MWEAAAAAARALVVWIQRSCGVVGIISFEEGI